MDRRGFLTQAPFFVAAGAISARDLAGHAPGGIMHLPSSNAPSPYRPEAPPPPNMPREAAFKLLQSSAPLRNEIRKRLFEDSKYAVTPNTIDPDIAILKSVSPMAKLFLARQRYVELGIEATLHDQTFSGMHGRLRDFMDQKAHDLMWGEKSLLSSILGTS